MKVLVDSCLSWRLADVLEEAGHDVLSASRMEADPGDAELMRIAFAEDRVIITLDKDFGELAALKGQRHAGIMRITDALPSRHAQVALRSLQKYGVELSNGAIVTVMPGRSRVRPPEPNLDQG